MECYPVMYLFKLDADVYSLLGNIRGLEGDRHGHGMVPYPESVTQEYS